MSTISTHHNEYFLSLDSVKNGSPWNTYSNGQTASAHVYMSHVSAGGSISSGEPERDAVYVVPDWVRARLQSHEQVWRSPEEVPRDREGEAFLTGF